MTKAMVVSEGDGGPPERRKAPRAELQVRVDYQTVDDLFSDFARNINEGGLFVETDTPPPVGSGVDLQLRLPGSEEPLRLKGTVVRIAPGDAGELPGMGIEFGDLDAEARRHIDTLVRALRTR